MDKKIFGVYIRVSTDGQVENGDSIEMQENLAKEFVEKEGGLLYKIYTEGGVSATKSRLTDRRVLMECLNDIEKDLFDNLIVYKRDRLSRSPEDTLAIRTVLEKHKCQIHFTATGEQQMVLNDPYNKMMEGIYSSLAEIESYQTSVRVSDTMFNNAKKGKFTGGNVTYGYINKEGYLTPIESQIPIIEEIVELYLEGYGVHSIVLWLEGKEVRNKGKRHTRAKKILQHKRGTSKWTRDNVLAVLFNLTYSGYMQYTRKINDINETITVKSNYIQPIRSKGVQDRINLERKKRGRGIRPPRKYTTRFLLTGILVCSECGKEYSSRTVTKGNGKRYSYYLCKGRHNHTVEPCKSKTFKKEILEEFILEESKSYIKEFINSDIHLRIKNEISEKDEELTNKLCDVTDDLSKKQKDFSSMSRLILDLNNEDETYKMMRDMYQEQQKSILVQINTLKESRIKIEEELKLQTSEEINIDKLTAQLRDFNEVVDFAPLHIQKEILDSLFSRIEIDAIGNINFYSDLEIRKTESTVDFATVGSVEHNKDSVMFLGGVGEPRPTKNITLSLNEKAYSINYFEWLGNIIEFLSDDFFDFILSRNNKLGEVEFFCNMTGLSKAMLYEYRHLKRLPNFQVLKKLLKASNYSIQKYSERVVKHVGICNENIIENVLNERNTIRKKVSENLISQ